MNKTPLGINVLEASQQRIKWVFDNFRQIYLCFSGGKDSTVMLHLVLEEVKKREQKIGVLFIDLEAQYQLTIVHVKNCLELYQDYIGVGMDKDTSLKVISELFNATEDEIESFLRNADAL